MSEFHFFFLFSCVIFNVPILPMRMFVFRMKFSDATNNCIALIRDMLAAGHTKKEIREQTNLSMYMIKVIFLLWFFFFCLLSSPFCCGSLFRSHTSIIFRVVLFLFWVNTSINCFSFCFGSTTLRYLFCISVSRKISRCGRRKRIRL